jgi:hypothetical protein
MFESEPVPGLSGLGALGDPDDDRVAAVLDVAVIGARGDGKTQFIVHAIRTLRAHAPALTGAEQAMNRDVLRVVLDPRAPRPDATPPGVVPHYTFRVRPAVLLGRLGTWGAARLLRRAGGVAGAFVVAAMVAAAIGAVVAAATRQPAIGVGVGSGALVVAGAIAWIAARRRLARAGDVEVAFWDVAGEHVYSSSAADYYALLAALVEARRRRADELGRGHAFAPVLICNPVALGSTPEAGPYQRLRRVLPLFASLDRDASRALVAINRWRVVDSICARGAPRDEVIAVTASARGEPPPPAQDVARDVVRECCLDAEDGRDGEVAIEYMRYDTAIDCDVSVDEDTSAIAYTWDDGPGAFTDDAQRRFLGWLLDLVRWPAVAPAVVPVGVPATALGSIPPATVAPDAIKPTAPERWAPPGNPDVWSRPQAEAAAAAAAAAGASGAGAGDSRPR